MNNIPDFLTANNFAPNKAANYISVDSQGIDYANGSKSPASLYKVRNAVNSLVEGLQGSTIPASDQTNINQFKNNITLLNQKFNQHNQSFDKTRFGKMVNLASRVTGFFIKNLGTAIHNYFHIETIKTQPWNISYNIVNDDDNDDQPISTDTMKVKEDDDQGSSSEQIESDDEDSDVEGTFIERNDVTEDSDDETVDYPTMVIKKTVEEEDVGPAPKENAEEVQKDYFAKSGPKWAKNFTGYRGPGPEINSTIPGKSQYFIALVNPDNTLSVLPQEDFLCDLPDFDTPDENPRSRSHITFQWEITNNVKCYNNSEEGFLFISNNSKHRMKILSENDQRPKVIKKGKSITITHNGTYMFWLDNKEKTGFFITKR